MRVEFNPNIALTHLKEAKHICPLIFPIKILCKFWHNSRYEQFKKNFGQIFIILRQTAMQSETRAFPQQLCVATIRENRNKHPLLSPLYI